MDAVSIDELRRRLAIIESQGMSREGAINGAEADGAITPKVADMLREG